jgi:hypothetical protein
LTTDVKTIAVIGLGYVGLPLAVEFGKSQFFQYFSSYGGETIGGVCDSPIP